MERTERGWAGHFICADRCLFRRNTLLEHKNIKIVISTVGGMKDIHKEGEYEQIGYNRYYETMAFHSKKDDKKYHDIDVGRQIYFKSNWVINVLKDDIEANKMHEKVVDEITKGLLSNNTFKGGNQ